MEQNRLREFLTVLGFALVAGVAIWAAMAYTQGKTQTLALILIIGAAIVSWQFLRKRFGRNR